jgi:hypothetical protein
MSRKALKIEPSGSMKSSVPPRAWPIKKPKQAGAVIQEREGIPHR